MEKVRSKHLTTTEAKFVIDSFEADFAKFTFVPLNLSLIDNACKLIDKYSENGLRTLDSLQLASILVVKKQLSFVVSADELLKKMTEMEGVETR